MERGPPLRAATEVERQRQDDGRGRDGQERQQPVIRGRGLLRPIPVQEEQPRRDHGEDRRAEADAPLVRLLRVAEEHALQHEEGRSGADEDERGADGAVVPLQVVLRAGGQLRPEPSAPAPALLQRAARNDDDAAMKRTMKQAKVNCQLGGGLRSPCPPPSSVVDLPETSIADERDLHLLLESITGEQCPARVVDPADELVLERDGSVAVAIARDRVHDQHPVQSVGGPPIGVLDARAQREQSNVGQLLPESPGQEDDVARIGRDDASEADLAVAHPFQRGAERQLAEGDAGRREPPAGSLDRFRGLERSLHLTCGALLLVVEHRGAGADRGQVGRQLPAAEAARAGLLGTGASHRPVGGRGLGEEDHVAATAGLVAGATACKQKHLQPFEQARVGGGGRLVGDEPGPGHRRIGRTRRVRTARARARRGRRARREDLSRLRGRRRARYDGNLAVRDPAGYHRRQRGGGAGVGGTEHEEGRLLGAGQDTIPFDEVDGGVELTRAQPLYRRLADHEHHERLALFGAIERSIHDHAGLLLPAARGHGGAIGPGEPLGVMDVCRLVNLSRGLLGRGALGILRLALGDRLLDSLEHEVEQLGSVRFERIRGEDDEVAEPLIESVELAELVEQVLPAVAWIGAVKRRCVAVAGIPHHPARRFHDARRGLLARVRRPVAHLAEREHRQHCRQDRNARTASQPSHESPPPSVQGDARGGDSSPACDASPGGRDRSGWRAETGGDQGQAGPATPIRCPSGSLKRPTTS